MKNENPKIMSIHGDFHVNFFVSWDDNQGGAEALYYLKNKKVLEKLNQIEIAAKNRAEQIKLLDLSIREWYSEWKEAFLEQRASEEALNLASKLKDELTCMTCLMSSNKGMWVFVEDNSYRTCGSESIHAVCHSCIQRMYLSEDTIAGMNFDWHTCLQCQVKGKGKWQKLL